MSQDKHIMQNLWTVVIGLVIIALVIFGLAKNLTGNFYSLDSGEQDDPALIERIKPVANVTVAGDAPANAAAVKLSGKDVYTNACFACHGTGAAGAPKLGDKAAWTARISQGMDLLVDHAINGFTGSTGVMPAKGGQAALSDEAVKSAVEYLVSGSK